MAGVLDMRGGGHAWQGGMHWGGMGGGGCGVGGIGCSWQGGCTWQGGVHGRGACVAGEMATAAGDTHPTGMHSCCELNYWL